MGHFELLPPPSRSPTRLGVAVSLAVHVAVALPYLLRGDPATSDEQRVDEMVVFLVPPTPTDGGARAGERIDWSGVVGNGGAIERPLPKPDRHPEQTLPVGNTGEATPTEELATPGPAILTETALSEVEVDSTVERDPTSAAPVYPAKLLEKRIEGATFVYYVVDTTGRVDTTSIQVIRSSHPEFALSVRDALGIMKFRPAIQSSRKVRQWVQQSFAFKIVPPPPTDST